MTPGLSPNIIAKLRILALESVVPVSHRESSHVSCHRRLPYQSATVNWGQPRPRRRHLHRPLPCRCLSHSRH
jgi:hypothetical protein